MILGTAGHVDHGKTALVKALTGVDTDRLEEEKRRGITIDLGFAPLALDTGTVLGVVDVPGHEAFVRNMLAGATGVDLALLVVAADEGVMPQTREHLDILTLLGIRGGVVALTKTDLVDDEWLELVREDVSRLLRATPLESAPIVPTSAVSGAGLEAIRRSIADAVRALPGRDAADLFRLPVDRAFTVRGTGTVVTGTVWTGSLRRDDVVRVLPGTATARVRGIETHGKPVDGALPGTRTAVALAGVDVSRVGRGTVLVTDRGWSESRVLLAEVALLPTAPRPLSARTVVRFHLGTVELGARVISAGGALAPGMRKQARLILDEPVIARAGDRFVLRSASPLTTIGGGIVNDPLPPTRRSRPWTEAARSPEARLRHAISRAGASGVPIASLPVRLGAPPAAMPSLLDATSDVARRIADRLYDRNVLHSLQEQVLAGVLAYHESHPLDPGAPLQALRTSLHADDSLVDAVLGDLASASRIDLNGALVMRRGWAPELTPVQSRIAAELVASLELAGREPPAVTELEPRFGELTVPLLRHLERNGTVVQVELDRYYTRASVEQLVTALRKGMQPGQEYGPAELRELLGVSRKFLIPFLEYCDRTGITERRSAGRVVAPVVSARDGGTLLDSRSV
ncbi:MAG TPA: selenocysteine-specific translation elongation factor [Gemmatimonadaceae bacterium]|nr:selenocysteine-specific translation elongation factor [Gemmatimonadaceae bacterium]